MIDNTEPIAILVSTPHSMRTIGVFEHTEKTVRKHKIMEKKEKFGFFYFYVHGKYQRADITS